MGSKIVESAEEKYFAIYNITICIHINIRFLSFQSTAVELRLGVAIFFQNGYSLFQNNLSQTIPAATGLGTRWQNQRISPVVLLPLPVFN